MNAAVFLDRDNTLIDTDGDLGDPEGVRLLQGAASALASLRGLGYRMVVVTNQGGVARGKYAEEDVDKVNQRISEVIRSTSGASIDAFYFCPYHPQGTVEKYRREHPWRKPAPGMLLQAAKDMDLDLSLSWMVGDQMRDIEAGIAAGVRTILLSPEAEDLTPLRLEQIAAGDSAEEASDKKMPAPAVGKPAEKPPVKPHFRAKSLIEAVRIIAQQRTPDDVRMRQRAQAAEGVKPDAPTPGLFAGVAGEMATNSVVVQTPVIATVLPTPKSSSTRNLPRPTPVPPVKPPPSPSPVTPSALTHRPAPSAVTVVPAAPIAPPVQTPEKPPENSIRSAGVQSPPLPPVSPSPQPAPSPVAPVHVAPPAPAPPPVSPAPPAAPTQDAAKVEAALREILREMRNHRGDGAEFSSLKMIAVVIQMVVVVCFLGALFIGQGEGGAFSRWIYSAILMQLWVIAALMFRK